jgi:hypothetical protein
LSQHLPAFFRLQRRKPEDAFFILLNDEVDSAVTKITYAVKKDYGR